MDLMESYFLSFNKNLEDKVNDLIHVIESRLDKLSAAQNLEQKRAVNQVPDWLIRKPKQARGHNSFSKSSFVQFKAPYIRDRRKFSAPVNDDQKHISELSGTENIDELLKQKSWTEKSKQLLRDCVIDFYAQRHLLHLIKQKNDLIKKLDDVSTTTRDRLDLQQKLNLIEEQCIQVRSRKEPRIFVPQDRHDPSVDWCSISARLEHTSHDAEDCKLMWLNNLHPEIFEGAWTKDEEVCLLNAVQKFGTNDWDSVAKELNSNRLPWQCCSHYHQQFSYQGNTTITEGDIEKIIEVINLCRIGNFVPWNQVMYFVKYHSVMQVKYQWQKLLTDRSATNVGSWTHEEDTKLLGLVERYGPRDWNRIANEMPQRTNKSCRERYTMRLKYQYRSVGVWRKSEDRLLLALVARFGPNWSLITTHLKDRNNHQLRSRYELLKAARNSRAGTTKRTKLYRDAEGFLVQLKSYALKPRTDHEVEQRLRDIFTSYQSVSKTTPKSLVCRSAQDDVIYQALVNVLRDTIVGQQRPYGLLSNVIHRSIEQRVTMGTGGIMSPNIATLRGYRAWLVQQSYLSGILDMSVISEADMRRIEESQTYRDIRGILMGLFMWPALLARLRPPRELDGQKFQTNTLIHRNSKNLYKVRELQKQIASFIGSGQ